MLRISCDDYPNNGIGDFMRLAFAIFAAVFLSNAKGEQIHYRVSGEVTGLTVNAGPVPAHIAVGASFIVDVVFDPIMASDGQRPDPVSSQFLFSEPEHFSISGTIAGVPLIRGKPVA